MSSMKDSSRAPRYTQQELLRVFLRNDLYAFVQKVFETVNPGVAFSRNWSTEAVTHALQKVVSSATTRLIINIPPRNLKSICSSVALPAFLLGHSPTRKIICVSYSDDLAAKFSNDCRAVMRSDWYKQTFPRARIDKAKDTESEMRTTERGYRLATSVGGTLTGRGGGHHHYRRSDQAAGRPIQIGPGEDHPVVREHAPVSSGRQGPRRDRHRDAASPPR